MTLVMRYLWVSIDYAALAPVSMITAGIVTGATREGVL
jgi:hypothetical protein